MRVLFFDLDTLRADHLGCYGYGRDTSPNIDSVASEGVTFTEYYCPNAPCLPSRASLITGRYGINNGIVGHDGTAADMVLEGQSRGFKSRFGRNNLFYAFRTAGMYTASISTFAERHSAFWFYAGFNEIHNIGKSGHEIADEVSSIAEKWLAEHARRDNWFLHVNFWDPHTPYRTPQEYGEPFKDVPLPDNWISEEIFERHLRHGGPHGAKELSMYDDSVNPKQPRAFGSLNSLAEVKQFIDNYDTGIKYMDEKIGRLLDILKSNGVYEDTAIIVTSDHGENMGELGIYAEHATADYPTCRIPMIIKWLGGKKNVIASGFHANVDLYPTVSELLGLPAPKNIDGISYARTILNGECAGRSHVILTQAAHVIQRAARWDDYIYIRTYHCGYHLFDDEMLFNVKEDPHQINNLAKQRPDLCATGAKLIFEWQNENMLKNKTVTDPLWCVNAEGGPCHAKCDLKAFVERLKRTGRAEYAQRLEEKYLK